jgi:hypothetical protein
MVSFLSSKWQQMAFRFRVLYRVFVLRVIDLELLSVDGDPSRLMGQFAAVFVTISFFSSFPVPLMLWGKKPIPVAAAYMFEHFFIETTMTIAGLIAVLSWDAAYPDRRDMLVLGPLPVRTATMFFAKLAALLAGPLLSIGAFNLFVGFSWPMVFAVGVGGSFSLLRTFPAYWATMLLAGMFLVLVMLAVQGLAANFLPRQVFLRLSPVLQAAALCLLLSAYFLGPSFNSPKALAAAENHSVLRWLPAYWFVGLFNQLNGSMHPELVLLAHRAWAALGLAVAGTVTALLLSYFRMVPRILEQPEIVPAFRSPSLALGGSLGGVMTMFSFRTLMRSRLHRMILSFYVGVGLTIIFGFIHTKFVRQTTSSGEMNSTYLLASILTVSLTVLAMRVVIAIPISLKANWIFRTTQARDASLYHRAARIVFLALCVGPGVVVLSTALFSALPRVQVMAHLVAMALLGTLIVELCLLTFRKIPFACSYLPGKANLHFVFWAALFGSIYWLRQAASWEGRVLDDPLGTVEVLIALAAMVVVMHLVVSGQARRARELVFEEEDLEGMVVLRMR